MTASFSHHVDLAASPAEVFTVLTDPALLVARYEASGARGVEVVERHDGPDGGLRVVYRRVEAGGLSGPIAKLVRGAAQVTQTDEWEPAGPDGARRARWTVRTKGVAVDIGGTIELAPHDGGTRLTEGGTVTARIPVVGAVIERVAGEQSGVKLQREWTWLVARLR